MKGLALSGDAATADAAAARPPAAAVDGDAWLCAAEASRNRALRVALCCTSLAASCTGASGGANCHAGGAIIGSGGIGCVRRNVGPWSTGPSCVLGVVGACTRGLTGGMPGGGGTGG